METETIQNNETIQVTDENSLASKQSSPGRKNFYKTINFSDNKLLQQERRGTQKDNRLNIRFTTGRPSERTHNLRDTLINGLKTEQKKRQQ